VNLIDVGGEVVVRFSQTARKQGHEAIIKMGLGADDGICLALPSPVPRHEYNGAKRVGYAVNSPSAPGELVEAAGTVKTEANHLGRRCLVNNRPPDLVHRRMA